jgi:hypothetical protein
MNSVQVQAWIKRTPSAAGSADYQRLALSLGRSFEGLDARVSALPPTPAPLPVIEDVGANSYVRPNPNVLPNSHVRQIRRARLLAE